MKKTNNKKYLKVLMFILLVPFFSNFSLEAQSCGDSWELVNYQVGPYVLRAVASNGSRFVAVGDAGLVWTSEDGIDWTPRSPNVMHQFGIIYGGGIVFYKCSFEKAGRTKNINEQEEINSDTTPRF